jgi:hypothetical protein
MTAQTLTQFRRVERAALMLAIVAAVMATVLGWFAPTSIVPAWRLAAFACL